LSSPLKRGKIKWGIVFSNKKKNPLKAQILKKHMPKSLFKVKRSWGLDMHD
jgi:hypothetical protein